MKFEVNGVSGDSWHCIVDTATKTEAEKLIGRVARAAAENAYDFEIKSIPGVVDFTYSEANTHIDVMPVSRPDFPELKQRVIDFANERTNYAFAEHMTYDKACSSLYDADFEYPVEIRDDVRLVTYGHMLLARKEMLEAELSTMEDFGDYRPSLPVEMELREVMKNLEAIQSGRDAGLNALDAAAAASRDMSARRAGTAPEKDKGAR